MKQTEQRFQVFVRLRPFTAKETEEITALEQATHKKTGGKLSLNAYNFLTKFHADDIRTFMRVEGNCLQVIDNEYKSLQRKYKPYLFNQIFGTESSNNDIFSQIEKNVERLFEGFNFTIFTYGITGSGKTYTVFGNSKEEQDRGICHLIYEYLLKRKKKIETVTDNVVTLKFSFFEVYNQNVRDLLASDSNRSLNVVEDNKGNTVVSELVEKPVSNLSEIYTQVQQGQVKRVLTSTTNNLYSSRSHALQELQVEVSNSNGYKNIAKLFIVDLAGSEKMQSSKNKCIIEGANINKSLLALANCITLLASNKNNNHIPYRDSKLTRILKESLGGNANTLMITCISPNPFLIEETITTLNYASRASGIQKKITRNFVQPEPKDKQNIDMTHTPVKRQHSFQRESLQLSSRRTVEVDVTAVSRILSDVRENAVERHQLEEMLKVFRNSPSSLEIEGAITVNEYHKNQLEGLFRSLLQRASLPLSNLLTAHQSTREKQLSNSGFNSEKKPQRKSLKFQRPRVLSSLNNTLK